MSDQLSTALAALADPTRRDVVARLTAGAATVGALALNYVQTFTYEGDPDGVALETPTFEDLRDGAV